jgi:hypothetical protein
MATAAAAGAEGRPSLLARHAFELLIFIVCALLAALCVVSAPIILEAGESSAGERKTSRGAE